MAFKRKRVFAPKRAFGKRRKTFRRKFRRSTGLTSKSSSGSAIGFRAKKVTRRRWNNMLWNSTLMLTHYRSNSARAVVLTTDITASTGTFNAQSALKFGVNQFYTTAGGLQPQLSGTVAPVFEGDKIIRGGLIGARFTNESVDPNPIFVNAFLVKTNSAFLAAALPAFVADGWDPSIIPDFKQRVGRILLSRKFQLENANSAELTFRLPIFKMEDNSYINDRETYVWVFVLSNSVAGIANVSTQFWYNLSFTADATT